MISVAVKEDDLDGVPVVAGPLRAFYEKLRQLLLKLIIIKPIDLVVLAPRSVLKNVRSTEGLLKSHSSMTL